MHKDNNNKKWLLHIWETQKIRVSELEQIETKNRVQKIALYKRKKLLDEITKQLNCNHQFTL